jgi:Fe-S cluster assembly ATP-binding protein
MSKLEIKNLKVETDCKIVVDGVSLSLSSGEINILMGPNGSGKSSLVNAVMGYPNFFITGGQIMLDGKDITKIKTDEKAKSGIFLSMQHLPEIAGVTIVNFLHRAYKILRNKDITVFDFYKLLEEKAVELGIDTELLKRELNVGFSGGEKKQAELLQLSVFEPKFAFLDEIDSGVDMDAVKKIFSGIKKLSDKGTGFLLITHYSDILKNITPDNVYIMKDEKILRSGGEELINDIKEKGF